MPDSLPLLSPATSAERTCSTNSRLSTSKDRWNREPDDTALYRSAARHASRDLYQPSLRTLSVIDNTQRREKCTAKELLRMRQKMQTKMLLRRECWTQSTEWLQLQMRHSISVTAVVSVSDCPPTTSATIPIAHASDTDVKGRLCRVYSASQRTIREGRPARADVRAQQRKRQAQV